MRLLRSLFTSTGLIGLLLASCISTQKKFESRLPANTESEYYSGFQKVGTAEPLDCKTFIDILKTKKFSSVGRTLAYLRERYPKYMSFHTFMYASQSIQTTTYQRPRAIVFGPEAKFIFTFNQQDENHSLTGTDAIEFMCFNDRPDTKAFELYEVRYRDDADDKSEFHNQPLLLEGPNPSKCLGCHSGRTENQWAINSKQESFNPLIHPIWDPYPFWRGAYGGIDDDLTGRSQRVNLFASTDTIERREYSKFMDANGDRHKGRYNYLPPLNPETDLPNADFTGLLAYLNFERIGHQLKISSNKVSSDGRSLKDERYSLLFGFSCGAPWNSPEPYKFETQLNAAFSARPELGEELRQKILFYQRRYYEERTGLQKQMQDLENGLPFFNQPNGDEAYELAHQFGLDFARMIAPAFTFAAKSGIDVDNWGLNVTAGGVNFHYGTNEPNLFARTIIKNLFSKVEQAQLLPLYPPDADFVKRDLACPLVIDGIQKQAR